MPTAEMPTAEVDLPVLAAAPEPPVAQPSLDALPNSSVRAIVIDAHAPSRVGLAALLDEQPWIERCLLASGSEESVSLTRRHRPDVALLDISQTGPFAAAITAQIRDAHPGVQILLTSRCRTSPGAPPASLGAVGFLPAGVVLFIFGYLVYLALIKPVRNRSHFMQILMTTGIGLILTDSAQLIFKADYRQTNIDLVNRSIHIGPFGANAAEVLSFAISIVFVFGLYFFVSRSLTGQALRAISQSPEVAPLMGINLTRIQGFSFALGTALAGVAAGQPGDGPAEACGVIELERAGIGGEGH